MQHAHRITIALGLAALLSLGWSQAVAAQSVVGPTEQPQPLTQPTLVVTKTADVTTVAPGGDVTYTVKVQNTGTAAATGLKLNDILPVGFTVSTTDTNAYTYAFLGSLEPGKAVLTSYTATVGSTVEPGDYVNVATVSASNPGLSPVTVRATVTVKAPVVKGISTTQPTTQPTGTVLGAEDQLPATGAGQLDVFLALVGAGLLSTGLFGLRRIKRPVKA